MVSKKILGAAIAAVMASSSAFAALDLTAGVDGVGTGALVYAKETITNAQVTSGLVQVTSATDFDTTFDLGFGTSAGSHAFIRIDLTGGAKFLTGVDATKLTLTGKANPADYTVSVGQGGAAGQSFVIFDVTSVTEMAQAQDLVLNLADMQVSPTAAAGITVAHYSGSPAAVTATATNTTGALATDSYSFASVVPALTVTITATPQVANVSADPAFTTFVSSGNATASIGSVRFDLLAGAKSVAGVAVSTLAHVMDSGAGKSQVAITSGDLSFIGLTDAATTATKLTFGGVNADVNATAASLVSTGKLSTLSGQAIAAVNNVVLSASSAINAGDYSVTFTPVNIADAYFTTVVTASGSLGTITRSGTTIQVPYLTTYEAYKQRLVLVNRSALAAPYVITFTPEAGVTATGKTTATTTTGTLAAGKTLITQMSDIVTITGGSRTAATVVVTAPSTSIDAATTIINTVGGGTDTVKLQ